MVIVNKLLRIERRSKYPALQKRKVKKYILFEKTEHQQFTAVGTQFVF